MTENEGLRRISWNMKFKMVDLGLIRLPEETLLQSGFKKSNWLLQSSSFVVVVPVSDLFLLHWRPLNIETHHTKRFMLSLPSFVSNCSSFLFCLPVLVDCSKNYNTHEHQQMSVWVLLAVGLHVTSVYEQTTFTWLHRRHFTVINLTKTQNDSASHHHASCKPLSLIKSIK